MIELLLQYGADPGDEPTLRGALADHVAAVKASARGGNRAVVAAVEAEVRADPAQALAFDDQGAATLTTASGVWHAGRFETPTLGALRARALAARERRGTTRARARLWVLDGASPATDIGALHATAGAGTLFQVASQFNCLESPGPYVTKVAHYFSDPTQGPRASVSAFPGTFVRHYAAPGADGGERFVQVTDGPQIDLLADVCDPDVARVRNGYLRGSAVTDPAAFAATLEARFDDIRAGVHDDVQVVLGFNWDGAVEDSPNRRVGQVFTSTLAGGMYSGMPRGEAGALKAACRQLLRAAYAGTLLAAATLDRPKVVLTLIGGGVFGNPIPLIWDSILWALEDVERVAPADLDVVVNGRNLGSEVADEDLLAAIRPRGGALVGFNQDGTVDVLR